MCGLLFGTLAIRKAFSLADKKELMRALCDGFTVPAVVMLCVGCLVLVSGSGIFNGLSYIGRAILGTFIPGLKLTQKSYKEYKEAKTEQEKKPNASFLFILGSIFFAIAMVFLVLYYKY